MAIIAIEQKLTFAQVVNPAEVTVYEKKDCEIVERDPYSKYIVDVEDGALLVEFDGEKYWCDGNTGGFVINEPDGDYECKLLGNVKYIDTSAGNQKEGQGAIYIVKKAPKNFCDIVNTDLEQEYWQMIAALHARFVASNNFDEIPESDIEFAASIITEEPTYTLLDIVNLFKFIKSNLGLIGESIPGRAFNNVLLNRFRTYYNMEKAKALETLRTKEKKDRQARSQAVLGQMPEAVYAIANNMNVTPKTWVQKQLARKGADIEEAMEKMSPERRVRERKRMEEQRLNNYKRYWDDIKAQQEKAEKKKKSKSQPKRKSNSCNPQKSPSQIRHLGTV